MDEQTNSVGPIGEIDRREMIKRSAFVLGATALWSTPLVQTLGMRPASAVVGSPDDTGRDFCPTDGGPNNRRAKQFVFKYLGDGTVEISLSIQGGGETTRTFSPVANGEFVQTAESSGINDVDVIIRDSDGVVLYSWTIHTSCSIPFLCGDEFAPPTSGPVDPGTGVLQVVAGLDYDGETVNCGWNGTLAPEIEPA